MTPTKGLLIDVDGTLCLGNRPIAGTAAYVAKLKAADRPFLILSNNSSLSSAEYLQKMRRMGFDVERKDVLTATEATVRYLNERYPGRKVYAIGMTGFLDQLAAGGVRLVEKDPDIVLLAYDKTVTFEKLNKGARFIMNGATFIATHPDVLCNAEDGYDIDIGSFICLLEGATGVKPLLIGKPEVTLADMAAERLGLAKKDLVVVGDRLYTDIAFAKRNGMTAVMVLSGESKQEDVAACEYKPDYIIGSVLDVDEALGL